jgi:hypothetical protein
MVQRPRLVADPSPPSSVAVQGREAVTRIPYAFGAYLISTLRHL